MTTLIDILLHPIGWWAASGIVFALLAWRAPYLDEFEHILTQPDEEVGAALTVGGTCDAENSNPLRQEPA